MSISTMGVKICTYMSLFSFNTWLTLITTLLIQVIRISTNITEGFSFESLTDCKSPSLRGSQLTVASII